MSTDHPVETCTPPKPTRRWRNALWVCPTCARAWVLKFSAEVAPHRYEDSPPPLEWVGGPVWQWWPWPPMDQP